MTQSLEIDTESLLAGEPDSRELEALLKRVTVTRKLHARYQADLTRHASDEIASAQAANRYCRLLIDRARAERDWKLLNGAFWALDGQLAEPTVADADGALAADAQAVLEEL